MLLPAEIKKEVITKTFFTLHIVSIFRTSYMTQPFVKQLVLCGHTLKIICALKSKYVKLLTTLYKRLTNCFLNADRRDSPLVNVWDCNNVVRREHKVSFEYKYQINSFLFGSVTYCVNGEKTIAHYTSFFTSRNLKKRRFAGILDVRDLTKMVVRWKKYKRTICFCSLINWFSNLTLKYT